MQRRHIRLKLKSVGVMSMARFGCVAGLLYYGLILGGCLFPLGLYTASSPRYGQGVAGLLVLALGAIALIVGGSLLAAIVLAVHTVIFNIVNGIAGGIEVDYERQVQVMGTYEEQVEDYNPVRNAQDLNEMIKKQRTWVQSKSKYDQ